MHNRLSAQTTVEYLILLSIVLAIAVFGILVLVDFTPIANNGGMSQTDMNKLQNSDIGTTKFAIGYEYSTFELKNNRQELVQVTELRVGGINCDSSLFPLTLGQGVQKVIACNNINSSEAQYEKNYTITWSKPGIGANITTELTTLVGDTAVQLD